MTRVPSSPRLLGDLLSNPRKLAARLAEYTFTGMTPLSI